MSKPINMTQGKPLQLLFFFALPLTLGNIFQQLYTLVDTAIVGRGVGMNALAALGTVDWLNWMLLGIAQGFTQGFSVRVSQKFGEGDGIGLKQIVGQSAWLSVLIAVLGAVCSQLGLPLFLTWLRVPEDLLGMAAQYSRIVMGGFPVIVFFNFCSSVLRAVGDSKTPLKAMMISAGTNIVLDCIAVFVLGWGIAGAAAATVCSQCLSGIICAHRLWKTPELHFGRQQLSVDPALSGNLIRIGAPMAIKNIIIALGGMTIQTIVNGFGISFIAGFIATNKLYGLLEIAAISYGYSVTTYVGQNYGAGKIGRIKSGMNSAVLLCLATSVVIGVIMIAFGRPITLLFLSSKDPALIAAAGDTAYVYLCFMSVSLPILYLLHVYQAALQGMGNTIVPMVSGVIEFALRVGISIFVGLTGYEIGIFCAEVSAWFGAGIFLMIHYSRQIQSISVGQL